MVETSSTDLETEFMRWARDEQRIVAVVLFGSRARAPANAGADQWSDVDLHLTTTAPEIFATREWTRIFTGRKLWAYAVRSASGGVTKVTALFCPGQEIDIVVIPAWRFRIVRLALTLGLVGRMPVLSYALNEMATLMRSGHRVLKGGAKWARLYSRVVTDMPGYRLNDSGACALAEEFVCDYVWLRQKVGRGELVAAQRVLHRSISEINFLLLHELRLRRGVASYREARRIEFIAPSDELESVSVRSGISALELNASAERAAVTCRILMQGLVGERWQWPDLSALRLRAE